MKKNQCYTETRKNFPLTHLRSPGAFLYVITAPYARSRPIFTQSVVETSPDHVRDRSLLIVRGVGGGGAEHLGHLLTFQSGFLFVLFESIFSDNFLYSFKIFQSSYRLAIGYFAGKD